MPTISIVYHLFFILILLTLIVSGQIDEFGDKNYKKNETLPNPMSYHVAIIVHGSYESAICSGAIIDPRLVITAAHCVEDHDKSEGFLPAKKIQVFAGINNTSELIEAAKNSFIKKNFTVKSVIGHPQYYRSNRVNKSSKFYVKNDIALLELINPLFKQDDNLIQAINLPDYKVFPSAGWTAIATGFSDIKSGQFESGKFTYNRTKILSNEICKKNYSLFDVNNMICTNGRSKLICPGDQGGPLAICDQIQGCTLVAIHILGSECGSYNPNYYMLVANSVNWINEKINKFKSTSKTIDLTNHFTSTTTSSRSYENQTSDQTTTLKPSINNETVSERRKSRPSFQ